MEDGNDNLYVLQYNTIVVGRRKSDIDYKETRHRARLKSLSHFKLLGLSQKERSEIGKAINNKSSTFTSIYFILLYSLVSPFLRSSPDVA
jgi:hypothetical protein